MQTKENYHHSLFVCISFCTFVASRVITLEQNNEELRKTNGCHLVTQFSSNPTNRFILSELSLLAKVIEKHWNSKVLHKFVDLRFSSFSNFDSSVHIL